MVGSAAPVQAVAAPIAEVGVPLRVTVIDPELILPFALPTHSVSLVAHDPPGLSTFLAEPSKVTPVADRDETEMEPGSVITRTIITSGLFVVVKDPIVNVLPELQPPVVLESNVGLEPITTGFAWVQIVVLTKADFGDAFVYGAATHLGHGRFAIAREVGMHVVVVRNHESSFRNFWLAESRLADNTLWLSIPYIPSGVSCFSCAILKSE